MLQSAESWIRDYNIDGLRLDAIHAIYDSSADHIVAEIVRRVHAVRDDAWVIAESGLNDPTVMRAPELGGYGCNAAWADDFHHALRTVLTGERDGYYAEFGRISQLAKAFHRPHVHDGNYSEFRRRRFGAPADDVPPRRFVVFSQNHDQVGNRAFGDRLPAPVRPLAAFCTLLAPFVPMLFMGEEYGETAPFQFFSDHIDKRIADATREGRRREFAAFAEFEEDIPDPQDPATFERSKLTRERDPRLAELYAQLMVERRRLPPGDADAIEFDEEQRWLRVQRGPFEILCNFADEPRRVPCEGTSVQLSTHEPPQPSDGVAELPPTVRSAGQMRDVWPGRPFPLGATWDGGGTNFSIFSEHAESVDLCLFDEEGEEHRIQMTKRTALNWHCYVPGVSPGQRYGYRVHGPYSPHEGHRFNASKLLIDPYAKAIEGVVDWSDPERLLPYFADGSEDADLERHDQDDSAAIPKSIVIDDAFIWEGDRPPADPVLRDRDLRDARQGVHQEPSRRPRGPARHLRRAGVRSGGRLPAGAGRHGSRAAARPSHRRRVVPVRARSQELLGLQHDRLPGAALRVRRHRPPRRAGARVQGDGQGAAPRGHRGDPRRRLQPHRRGQPSRVRCCRSRA